MSKAIVVKKVESEQLRLKCSKIVLRCSYHIYQSHNLTAPPLIRHQGDSQRINLVYQNQKQTDQITLESTARESKSGYGIYEVALITRSIPNETDIPSDDPIDIEIGLLSQDQQCRGPLDHHSHCKFCVTICE